MHEIIGCKMPIAFVHGSKATCKSIQLKRRVPHILNASDDKSLSIAYRMLWSVESMHIYFLPCCWKREGRQQIQHFYAQQELKLNTRLPTECRLPMNERKIVRMPLI